MPQELNIINRKYYNQISERSLSGKTDSSVDNPAPFFHASSGSTVGVEKTYTLWWNVFLDDEDWVYGIEGATTRIISEGGTDFIEEGWKVGDLLNLDLRVRVGGGDPNTTFSQANISVLEVFSDQILLNFDFSIWDTYDELFQMYLSNVSPLDGAKYRYGFVENDDPDAFTNRMTNEDQVLYKEDVPASFSSGQMNKSGESDSWINPLGFSTEEDVKIREDARTDKVIGLPNGNPLTLSNSVYNFTVRHNVKTPIYIEEEIENNLESDIVPDYLEGNNSLRYYSELELRRVYNDPNEVITIQDSEDKGTFGWFGEEFNGFDPRFTVDLVTFQDLNGNVIDNIDVSGTDFLIEVEAIDPSYVLDEIALCYTMLTPETVYQDRDRDNVENTRFYSVQGGDGFSQSNFPRIIRSIDITSLSPQRIRLEGRIEPNYINPGPLPEDLVADETTKYLLYVVCGDSTKDADESGLISLQVSVGDHEKNTDIPDLVFIEDFNVLSPALVDRSDYVGAIEDTVTVKYDFKTDFVKNSIINSIAVNFIGYDPIAEDIFEIKRNNIPFDSNIIGGKQIISINEFRGFDTYDNLLNVLNINSTTSDSQFQFYELEYSTKIPFRENVSSDAPESFFDVTKPLNGINQKSDQFSGVNGYEVRVSLELVIESDGVETIYNLLSPEFRIFDYDTIIN